MGGAPDLPRTQPAIAMRKPPTQPVKRQGRASERQRSFTLAAARACTCPCTAFSPSCIEKRLGPKHLKMASRKRKLRCNVTVALKSFSFLALSAFLSAPAFDPNTFAVMVSTTLSSASRRCVDSLRSNGILAAAATRGPPPPRAHRAITPAPEDLLGACPPPHAADV